MSQWEVFVSDLSELPEGRDVELTIRTLEPGIHKYTYKRAKVRLSKSPDELPDRLQVRYGRGQLAPQRFSMHVLEEVQRLPAKYR
ncbi:MAG: phenylphosphate carboxylase subunit gamma [Gammaproteobacteria bacterium]|uniref:phenylphosphate carboxylase subunit gamma n=1 Tax=Azohydromonas sp. TaxID=1872666 RepID=UPI002B5E4ABA|nr:phenylphosphate carboxylase subunit gamma [Azohydromonas sp.]HMM86650.1 phenylphosphate carboxylase subunit gamma [Azohydromonas sp.]